MNIIYISSLLKSLYFFLAFISLFYICIYKAFIFYELLVSITFSFIIFIYNILIKYLIYEEKKTVTILYYYEYLYCDFMLLRCNIAAI